MRADRSTGFREQRSAVRWSEGCRGRDLENSLLKSVRGALGGTLSPRRENGAGSSALQVRNKLLVQLQESSHVVIM